MQCAPVSHTHGAWTGAPAVLLQSPPSSAAHGQSWALYERWMALKTIRQCLAHLPQHRWGLACPLLTQDHRSPAAVRPVVCLHRLDVLQSNRDLSEKASWQAHQLTFLRHACRHCQQADVTGCSRAQLLTCIIVTLASRPQVSTSSLPWQSRVGFHAQMTDAEQSLWSACRCRVLHRRTWEHRPKSVLLSQLMRLGSRKVQLLLTLKYLGLPLLQLVH